MTDRVATRFCIIDQKDRVHYLLLDLCQHLSPPHLDFCCGPLLKLLLNIGLEYRVDEVAVLDDRAFFILSR